MSVRNKILLGEGEKRREESRQEEQVERLPELEQALMKKKEFLKKRIDQELLIAKGNSRKNRKVALQALLRKKWYEKLLMNIDCAVKASRLAQELIDSVMKVNQTVIKDIIAEQDTSDSCDTFGVEFDENELLAELERPEKNLDEFDFEDDSVEEIVSCPEELSLASLPQLSKTEEVEVKKGLEYLRRWANEQP